MRRTPAPLLVIVCLVVGTAGCHNPRVADPATDLTASALNPGTGDLPAHPYGLGTSAHRVSVRRGTHSMQCARQRFEDLGYEFSAAAVKPKDQIGQRLNNSAQGEIQELVRLEALYKDTRPVLTMTVGRLRVDGIVREEAFPSSRTWVAGPRRSVEQADDILRHCQGSPFRR